MTWLESFLRLGLFSVISIGALCACGTRGGPEAGSQTHFLVPCEDRCGGGYECICGVCTRECVEDGMCSEVEGARCVASDERQECTQPVQMCDVECRADGDCEPIGEREFACEAGRCRQRAFSMDSGQMSPSDAGPDADAGCLRNDAGQCIDPCELDGGCAVAAEACELPAEVGPCDAGVARYFHNSATGACEPFDYGGCQGNANNFGSRGECVASCEPLDDAPCAFDATDPALPGVRLHVEADTCAVATGAPLQIRYRLELDAPIDYMAESSDGGCGHCPGYGSDPLALVRYSIGNQERQYCECDLGCCAPTESAPHTLAAGSYDAAIEWPGTEWNGPSDTSAPLGPAFPPGAYAIKLSFEVPGVGTLNADLPLRVTSAP